MGTSVWRKFSNLALSGVLRLNKNAVIHRVNSNGTVDVISLAELSLLNGLTATTAELNLNDGQTATTAEVNAVADVSGRVIDLDATSLSVTAATHGERIVLLSHTAAASTVTLPAATGTGNIYTFIVNAVNTNNHIIKVADATDVMYGNIITNSTGDTPDLAQPWPTAADSDTITLNGTTTGGQAVGDVIRLIDIATNKWSVQGVTTTSGTEATPFSATVS